SFGGPAILKDLSFELQPGQYLSVIGPNGAGKSTLLKCILRLHDRGRLTGNIFVKGRHLNKYGQKELARLISYVPQAGGWIPPFTVRELMRLSRYPYAASASGLNRGDRLAVERALELTGMGELAGRHLKTLSGGERQKAYLAAALAQSPEALLLDEPASFLDPRHASELSALLRKLNRQEGLTMITVTHDLNHPLGSGGLALALKEGRRVFFGDVSGLLEEAVLETAYQHKFIFLTHPVTGGPVVLAE
ncbi:MAG: ABC transporter ATP-binding protein, partial [Candidatus Adiutrix sp.]|nr:ABC transporter ATP-binding protein [Candidatus Adiutrix sp.]